ncbi:MAG: AI-2E family transporter [Methylococcales bacterium]|nr:AI-2E family transporter [Methylococcales bacterium]
MTSDNNDFTKNPVEITIKIAMTLLLFTWCFYIVQPFIVPLVWALIITVSIFPIYKRLLLLLRGRQKLTAVLITFCLLLIIVVPFVVLGGTIASSAESLARQLSDGTLSIPLPTQKVASWPLVGETLHKYWTLIATNPMDALKPIVPQIKLLGQWLISSGFSLTVSIFQLVMAIIISGVLLANAEGCHRLALAISKRFVGAKGAEFERMSEETIRSVANGVLGVAIIQSLLVGLGFWVADVPAAALLTLVCFFLAVIQVGPGLVVIPVTIYVFSFHDTVFSLIYLVWAVFAGLIDNVLKPLLMGRGSSIPMVIIFLGAIGGMIFSGLIGLFVGAVVLALGYELFRVWVFEEQ